MRRAWTMLYIIIVGSWKLPWLYNDTIVHALGIKVSPQWVTEYTYQDVNVIAHYPQPEIFHVSLWDKYALNALAIWRHTR